MTLVVFVMQGCTHCHAYRPRVEAAVYRHAQIRAARGLPPPRVEILDCDRHPQLADAFRVAAVPATFLVDDSGSIRWRADEVLSNEWLDWLIAQS